MNKQLDYIMLSDLIEELQQINNDNGDLCVGFEDDESYTTKCTLKVTKDGDIIFDISR
jgi:hypothetical protein